MLENLRIAARLHDLGKIGVPDRIVYKPGPLDPDEVELMRQHPVIGYELLEGLDASPVDEWILHHHEHWDGSGYPDGLARRGHPARLPDHPRGRRVRRDAQRPRLPRRDAAGPRWRSSCAGRAASSTRPSSKRARRPREHRREGRAATPPRS